MRSSFFEKHRLGVQEVMNLDHLKGIAESFSKKTYGILKPLLILLAIPNEANVDRVSFSKFSGITTTTKKALTLQLQSGLLEPNISLPDVAVDDKNNETNEVFEESNLELIQNLFSKIQTITGSESDKFNDLVDYYTRKYSLKFFSIGEDGKIAYTDRNGVEDFPESLVDGWNRMLENGHLKMVLEKCEKHKVPFELIFLALAESNWDPDATSAVGARGYWQFTESTAKKYGLIDGVKDDRSDPEKSTEAAISYLKYLYRVVYKWDTGKTFNEEEESYTNNKYWSFAMISYNRGQGHVRKDFTNGKGSLDRYIAKKIPIESRHYLAKVIGITQAIKSLYSYLSNEPNNEPDPNEVIVNQNISDKESTHIDKKWEDYLAYGSLSTPLERLKTLDHILASYKKYECNSRNIEYVSNMIRTVENERSRLLEENKSIFKSVGFYGDYSFNVSVVSGDFSLKVSKLGQEIDVEILPYKIKEGDNVSGIARKINPKSMWFIVDIIGALNPHLDKDNIKYGQTIIIPSFDSKSKFS